VTVDDPIICNDENAVIRVTSPSEYTSGEVTYNYKVVATGGVTGFTTPVTGVPLDQIISDPLNNPTLEEQFVTYTITPVSPNGCGVGDSIVEIITVNPTPLLNADLAEDIYCDSSMVTINVSDSLISSTGDHFFWIARDYDPLLVEISGKVPGIDLTPRDKEYGIPVEDYLVNLTDTVQPVYYQFHPVILDPSGGDCGVSNYENDILDTIWINPTPRLSVNYSDSIYCDSTTVTLDVVDELFNSTGTTAYHITREYNEDSILIETQGPGTLYNQAYGLVEDEVRNLTGQVQYITYRFKPVILDPRGDGSIPECREGSETLIQIAVNPSPRLSVQIDDQNYCDSAVVTFNVYEDIFYALGDRVYTVERIYDEDSIQIIGELPGTDPLDQQYGVPLTDEIINRTSNMQEVTYTFSPWFRSTGGAADCDNNLDTSITIYIEPTPKIEVEVNDTICNEDFIVFQVTNPNITLGDWKYRLEVDYGEFLTGLLPADSLYDELRLDEQLINTDTIWHQASYRFIPYIDPVDGDTLCQHYQDTTIYVRVNPTPAIRVIATDSILCNGIDVAQIRVRNPNEFVYGQWEYDLEVIPDPDPALSGYRDSDTSLVDLEIIDNLVNTDTAAHKVIYRFRPKRSYDGLLCGGGNDTSIVIWVNPTPEIRTSVSDPMICHDESITLNVRSPHPPDSIMGVWNYDLIIEADPGIGGIISDTLEGITTTMFNYTLTNSDVDTGVVRFRFHPRIIDDDFEECTEPLNQSDTIITVVVLPVPQIRVMASPDTLLCNNSELFLDIQNPHNRITGEWSYDLIIEADAELGGVVSDTLENIILTDTIFNLVNNDTTNYEAHSVTFTFKPDIAPEDGDGSCGNGLGDTAITIWVNPTPLIEVTVPDTIYCDSAIVSFDVTDLLGSNVFGDKMYSVVAIYDSSDVEVLTRAPGFGGIEYYPATSPTIVDTLINKIKSRVLVDYYFQPLLFDARGEPYNQDCDGEIIKISIYVNPTPEITVNLLTDSILCDSAEVEFEIIDELGFVEGASKVYELITSYETGKVENVSPSGIYPSEFPIEEYLYNTTDSFQVITYQFIARMLDTRPGQDSAYCRNGDTISFNIYLNPTIRLDYQLLEDTLCHEEGFTLFTDPLVLTTHPIYYTLGVENPDGIVNVNVPPPDSLLASEPLDESDIYNDGLGVGTLTYDLYPYISTIGCTGKDTSVVIKVNPEPLMQVTQSDTAVCFDWGYQLPMNSPILSTTGQLRYDLFTDGYNGAVVSGVHPDGIAPIVDLVESVVNTGDSIEAVTYHFMPVIENARASGNCLGDPLPPIIVEVAPELIGNMVSDTVIGGWEIRCHGLEDGSIESNVRGGYYVLNYDFDWDTEGGTPGNLDPEASDQEDLGAGKYWFSVEDRIGCFYTDTIILEQPDTLEVVDTTITFASCYSEQRFDGAIDIFPAGGTQGYNYEWWGPWVFGQSTEDLIDVVGSDFPYSLILRDTNNCRYDAQYYVGSAEEILITTDPQNYYGTGVSCYGYNDGEISLEVVGNNPDFDLYYFTTENPTDTVPAGAVTWDGSGYTATVSALPAGQYHLFVQDVVNCRSGLSHVDLLEPDSIIITKTNAPYFDTVDISCFGADDGFIDISVSGGHTETHPNIFSWTGPPEETDLVAGDSLQSSLGPGIYTVIVTDINNCSETAEFTLIENSQILVTDSIYEINGWNISCFEGSDGYIGINSSGGILNHSYQWGADHTTLPDPESASQGNLVAGTYYLTITDSIGCTRSDTFKLHQPNTLGVLSQISDTNGWEVSCYSDSSGWIQLTPFGGADSTQNTYFWSTPDGYVQDPGLMDQANIPAGSYTVNVTDINGCSIDSTFILIQPTALVIDTLESDSASCFNTPSGGIRMEVSGGFPGYTYLWSPEGQMADPTVEDPGGLRAGMYTVVVTDSNGCSVIDSVEVFEGDLFTLGIAPAVDYNGYPISCYGNSDGSIDLVPIGGTPEYSFEWNTGATTEDLEGVPAGTYRVVVTDFYGCEDSATIELVQPSQLAYQMQTTDPTCNNDSTGSIELMLTGGTVYSLDDYTVLLNDIVAEPFMNNLPEGNYLIRIVDLNECYVETEANLVDPEKLVLSFETENAFCKDKPDGQLSLNIEGGVYPYFITWDRGLTSGEDDFMDVYWGEYVATVTDANDCVVSDTAFVGYTYTSCLVIPNAFSPNSDGFNDLWIIEGLELYPQAEMRIFDRWGTSVHYSGNAADDPWDGRFNGRELPVDSYHYIIDLNTGEDPPVTGHVTIVR
jgi:gliding motility-associated-like protein